MSGSYQYQEKDQKEPFSYKAESLQKEINAEIENWKKENKIERLWNKDKSLWTNSDENEWLGWLDVSINELKEIDSIEHMAAEIKEKGYKDIVLLGMGGSSLCPFMLSEIFGKIGDYPKLHILDSTDPMQIHHLEEKLDLKKTFFIVSSKSGTTLEPNIFKDYFYNLLEKALGKRGVGSSFIAITDPGTLLETEAKDQHFKLTFLGVPSIGGRYSALSNFGMLPAGLMGIDIRHFLNEANKTVLDCHSNLIPTDNRAAMLGIILGVCAKNGKDKVTLIVSPKIKPLGAWLEQLLAESTGKEGQGIIPIDQEPLCDPTYYGNDRVFVYIRLEESPDANQDQTVDKLEKANQVVVRLTLTNKEHLGAELFQWEFATAVAGSVLGINAYNQPDVEGSKKLAGQLLDEYEKSNIIRAPSLLIASENIELYTDNINAIELNDILKKNKLDKEDLNLVNYLSAHFSRINTGDYFNISAFLEMSQEHIEILQRCRVIIRDVKKVATCLGFGPRFLHSTGQAYKGGPNTGVFLQITTDYKKDKDIIVPGKPYSFGTVIHAQAQADFEVLANRKRRVLRIHLKEEKRLGLLKILQLFEASLLKE